MSTVIDPSRKAAVATAERAAAPPSRLTTTLCELIAALHAVVGPEDDAQVVAAVVHLMRYGRLTWRGQARASRSQSWREAMEAMPRVAPQATQAATRTRPR